MRLALVGRFELIRLPQVLPLAMQRTARLQVGDERWAEGSEPRGDCGESLQIEAERPFGRKDHVAALGGQGHSTAALVAPARHDEPAARGCRLEQRHLVGLADKGDRRRDDGGGRAALGS